jgi:hypothetical protein
MREKVGDLIPGRVGTEQAARLRTLAASGQITYEDVAKVMPTYTAYVWHDSGTTAKSPSGTSKVLAPQPSFTLFVSHDGPLYGWTHELRPLAGGAAITEVAKNFYRIAVGPTGSTEVVTAIEALEQPPHFDDGGGEWPRWATPLLLLIGLLFLIALIRLLRRLIS